MNHTYLYTPVKDLREVIHLYKHVLGWQEAWREDTAVSFNIPESEGSEAIFEYDDSDSSTPGVMCIVKSVDEFYLKNKDIFEFLWPPRDIPPGRYTAFVGPSGNVTRILNLRS